MHKLFLTRDDKATLACPVCERSRTIDASPYITLSRIVKIRITCPCGYQYTAELERRRYYRKKVHFPGRYVQVPERHYPGRGRMAVVDLSRSGVKMRLDRDKNFRIGDRIVLEFQLDDAKRSKVRKESVVRRIDGAELGAEFTSTDPNDPNTKAIGFYLFAA